MRLNAVSVVEIIEDRVISARSFTDDEEGNKEATKLFLACTRENSNDAEFFTEDSLDDGVFTCGNYSVYLIHSNHQA